jgi:hypothetical protein
LETEGATTMSSTPSTARPRRARNASSSNDHVSSARPTTTPSIPTVSAEQRHSMIAESAYRRAERRAFGGGDPVSDWLESEREVDALLSRSTD